MIVNFLPKNNLNVEICDHRFGADMTFSHQTDSRFLSSIYTVEKYGFKNNIRLGGFANNLLSGQQNSDIKEQADTGLIRFDTYWSVDQWINENTGELETIPDYYSATWTALGATYFNVTVGETKPNQYPNHGQQFYDLTNGRLGYDFTTNTIGTSNLEEWKGIVLKHKEFSYENFKRNSSAASYRNGQRAGTGLMYIPWLGVRNSDFTRVLGQEGDTYYGSNLGLTIFNTDNLRVFFNNYKSTTRWWDTWMHYGVSKENATIILKQQIALAKINRGWFRDFAHWHSARSANNIETLDEFLSICKNELVDTNVHYCSNGEALEYMYIRELCSRVKGSFINNELHLISEIKDKFKSQSVDGIPLDVDFTLLNTPLSVEIDLTGTPLANKNVKSSYGKLVRLSANRYIAEIPFNGYEGFQTVKIFEGTNGLYSTSNPSIQTTVEGSKLIVKTDIPTKSVIFYGTNDTGIQRSNVFSTTHEFNINGIINYNVGVISEFNKTNYI